MDRLNVEQLEDLKRELKSTIMNLDQRIQMQTDLQLKNRLLHKKGETLAKMKEVTQTINQKYEEYNRNLEEAMIKAIRKKEIQKRMEKEAEKKE